MVTAQLATMEDLGLLGKQETHCASWDPICSLRYLLSDGCLELDVAAFIPVVVCCVQDTMLKSKMYHHHEVWRADAIMDASKPLDIHTHTHAHAHTHAHTHTHTNTHTHTQGGRRAVLGGILLALRALLESVSKETYGHGQRDLLIRQKRPIGIPACVEGSS